MARQRVRTGRIGGNQERIDELEYFVERVGGALFGADGEDFRKLRNYVPQTRNLSALIDLVAKDPARDIAEDMRFVYSELETRVERKGYATPDTTDRTVFSYLRYLDLLDHPEKLIEAVAPEHRLEVASLVTTGASRFGPMLAKLNAYAWLVVVGLPDLETELRSGGAAEFVVATETEAARHGLAHVLGGLRPATVGFGEYFSGVYQDLQRNYLGQLTRFATQHKPTT